MIRFEREKFISSADSIPSELESHMKGVDEKVRIATKNLFEIASEFGGLPAPLEAKTVKISLDYILGLFMGKKIVYQSYKEEELAKQSQERYERLKAVFEGVYLLGDKEVVPQGLMIQIRNQIYFELGDK